MIVSLKKVKNYLRIDFDDDNKLLYQLIDTAQKLSEREMTTSLFLLRCLQIGLSLDELDLRTIGMVTEMFIDNNNDDCEYYYIADQQAMDEF